MKTIDEFDIQELRTGKTEPLSKIFDENYLYCTRHIASTTNCSLEDSRDLVMDAIIVLREKIMMHTYSNDNVQAFILKVATNMWKNKQKKNRKILPFDPRIVQGAINSAEQVESLDDDRQRQVNVTLKALSILGNPCEALLKRNLIDRIPLRNLAEEMGYKNRDVMKTTKARCMKKLKLKIKELLENIKNE